MQAGQCVHATDGSVTIAYGNMTIGADFGGNYARMAEGYAGARLASLPRLSESDVADPYAAPAGTIGQDEASIPTRPESDAAPVPNPSVVAAQGGVDAPAPLPVLSLYRVEQDAPGCSACGHGVYWTVTWDQYGESHQISSSSSDKESMEDLCEQMNSARALALRQSLDVLNSLIRAVQMLMGREDFPPSMRESTLEWWRYKEALEWSARLEVQLREAQS